MPTPRSRYWEGKDISKLNYGQYPPVQVFVKWVLEGIVDLYPVLGLILSKLEDILANQDTINAFVARITAANELIASELADLKAQPGAEVLDFTGLESAVAGEEALEPAPVVVPPVDVPPVVAPPVDVPPADAPSVAAVTAS